ncbi:MAG: SusC/RagA family TonB-linked outer membrane protein [Taibaiella sp.]|nr:SusC/RagA family TonB-linked outer membrane protein [Taibaiella sp.]
MRKLLLTTLVTSAISVAAFAQTKQVSGTVVDDQAPLGGATIMIKGTETGTAADENGKFTLAIPEEGATLVIEYYGKQVKEIRVTNQSDVGTILLEESQAEQTDGVTVFGKKIDRRTYVGAIGTVTAEDIEKRPVTNAASALAGTVPGVTVTTGSGQPGSSPDIMLRGMGSLSANTAPLIVLDGAPYSGSLTSINPLDIASFDVLKDATSKAVYGARAANGVILITTKKGKRDAKPKIQFDASVGALARMGREYRRIMDQKQYYETAWQGYVAYKGQDDNFTSEEFVDLLGNYNSFNVPNSQLIDPATGKLNPNATSLYNDNWQEELSRIGIRQNYNLAVSHNAGRSDYYVSIGYTRDQGIVKNSDYNRITALLKTETQVTDWLKSGIKIQGARDYQLFFLGNNTSYVNPFFTARMTAPIYPVYRYDANGNRMFEADGVTPVYDFGYNTDGNFPGGATEQIRPFGNSTNGLAALMYNKPYSRSLTANGMTFLEATFAKDFKARSQFSVDLINRESTQYYNSTYGDAANVLGRMSVGYTNNMNYTFNQFVTWTPSFGLFEADAQGNKKHDLGLTVGHEAYQIVTRGSSFTRTGFALPNWWTSSSMAAVQEGSSDGIDNMAIEMYFAQLQYSLNSKYYFDASFSRNGSSRFGPNVRWGNFGAVSAGWVLSDEKFMASTKKWLDMLKVRAGWGVTGNDAINNYYAYLERYAISHNASNPGLIFANYKSDFLKWEESIDMNFGLDFSIKKARVSGSIDAYNRGSNKLLFITPLASSVGSTGYYDNVASMRNTGIELQVSADVVRKKDFNWNVRLNAFHNRNEVIEVQGKDSLGSGGQVLFKGHPAFSYFIPEYAGVNDQGRPTWFKKDGSVTADYQQILPEDYKMFGSAFRWLEGSISNNFRYKRLDLSFMFQFGLGGQFYDNTYANLMSSGPQSIGQAMHVDMLNAWKQPGDENNPDVQPRIDYGSAGVDNTRLSSKFLTDNSFLNFKNINLGYTVANKALDRVGFKAMRIYASAENVFQLASRIGIDPNVSFLGVSSFNYFPYRTFVLGVNVTLQ